MTEEKIKQAKKQKTVVIFQDQFKSGWQPKICVLVKETEKTLVVGRFEDRHYDLHNRFRKEDIKYKIFDNYDDAYDHLRLIRQGTGAYKDLLRRADMVRRETRQQMRQLSKDWAGEGRI